MGNGSYFGEDYYGHLLVWIREIHPKAGIIHQAFGGLFI